MNNSAARILIIVTRGTMGGAQMSVINLARILTEMGIDVTVAAGPGRFVAAECQRHNIAYQYMPHLRRSLNPLRMIAFTWHAKNIIDAEQFSVVHINSSNALFAAIAARLTRRKPRTVFTFRGLSVLDENYRNAFYRTAARWIFWLFMRFVDTPVFVCNANRDTAISHGIVRNGEVIYNGIDPEKLAFFERATARRELQQHTEKDVTDMFLVGSIGRLAYQKNYTFLIEQIARIADSRPDILCIIIGDGPSRDQLIRAIDQYNVREHVIFAGEYEHASRYMRAFDVFVLPSRYEGLSITLIEALFVGIPVLASDVGGAREQFSQAPFQV
jgi:glycosyltransferase involved in cell wall biosynthesis